MRRSPDTCSSVRVHSSLYDVHQPGGSPYRGMTTPAMEERIMELMREDAKAVLLLLARPLPYEVGQALDRIEGRRS